ncbi:MAG: hypothetical protein LBH98_01195 [Chitinispirillales bacterium]|jgi:hypothetical protein|nr:hypothetical protein [Chitinispirillales bacterium]
MKKIIIITITIIFSAFAETQDWAAQSGFQLLNISSGTKLTALGGAGAAVPADFSMHSNPANYGNFSQYRLSFEHLWKIKYSDLNVNRLEIFMPVKKTFMAVSVQNHTVDDIYIRDIFPESPPAPGDLSSNWQFSEFSYTIGLHRNKNFDWGISFGFAFDKFIDEVAYAFVMNGGFLWKLIDENLRIGLAFNNFGTTTPMINENGEKWGDGEKLPTSMKTGAAYFWKIKSLDFCVAGDILYWHIYDPNGSKIKNVNKRLQFPLGFEFSPTNWLDLRAGKTIKADYNVINFGFGLDVQYVNLDFTAAVNKYETSVEWEFLAGVSLNFGTSKKSEIKAKNSLEINAQEKTLPLKEIKKEAKIKEIPVEIDAETITTEEIQDGNNEKTKVEEIIESIQEEFEVW